jgi:peptidoglycan/xylan/chitin deacetylase (PgdA/CDA1 family)
VSALGRVVKVVAGGWDVVRHPRPGVVVLLYHRVGGGTGASVDLDVGLFSAQLEMLVERCTRVTLDETIERLDHADTPDDRAVAVTFDDGTADFAEHAVPLLVAHQVPATLYLATDFVESGRRFPDGLPPLSWGSLRDAIETGLVTVGSHTHTHRLLDRAEPAVVAEELDRSRELIEDRLCIPACHFAYPKARPGSAAADAAVRARFASAALAGTRANVYGKTDAFRLARSPVQTTDGLRWFAKKLRGGMALEDNLRQIVDRRRYANEVT